MEIQEYCVRVQLDVSKPLIRMFCLVFPDAEEPIGGFLLHVRSNGSCMWSPIEVCRECGDWK